MKPNDVLEVAEATTESSKKHYEAPFVKETDEMTFTKSIWENSNDGNWCFGCTNCNCN